jgi:hypothetical protein
MLARRISAGFLAGASSVASLMLLLAALLLISGMFGLIRDISTGLFGDIPVGAAIAQSMGRSLSVLPQYLWSARWGMMALGILGVALAFADAWRARIHRPWRDSLGYIVTNGATAAVVFATLYVNKDGSRRLIAEQPALYNDQSLLQVGNPTLLMVGLLMTLGLGFVVWAAWQWWYDRLARVLRVERPAHYEEAREAAAAPAAPSDDWRAYQDRLMRLKRQEQETAVEAPAPAMPAAPRARSWLPLLVGGLVVATLIGWAVLQLYQRNAIALVSGQFFLDANTPTTAFSVPFTGAPHTMTFSNNSGVGTVDIRLSDNSQTLKTLDGMALAGGPGIRSDVLDLQGLPPGNYRVDAALRDGTGGQVRFVGLHGGSALAQVAAVLFGLVAGAWIMCAHVLILELLARRGREH